MRFRVDPRDVPAEVAARRLGKSVADFEALLPKLIARGFPAPDPDTGNFDMVAIDRWCDARHAHLFGDAAAMQEVITSSVRDYPQLEPLMTKLLDERNTAMTAKIERFLQTPKTYFVAVGAGHLVGDQGILSQLRRKNFRVEQL